MTASEVATARDRLVALGLTRQQIAAVLGVSRRALSGWASGQIRPTLEHLARLRALLAAAEALATRHPGQVRERLLLPDAREPIWAAAAKALAEGRLKPFERRGTVRPESAYDTLPFEPVHPVWGYDWPQEPTEAIDPP